MTYSLDSRLKVLSLPEKEGLTIASVSARFSVRVASVNRWIKDIRPKVYSRKKFRKLDPDIVAEDVHNYPDAYQYERAQRLGVQQSSIHYILNKLGMSYKKILLKSKFSTTSLHLTDTVGMFCLIVVAPLEFQFNADVMLLG